MRKFLRLLVLLSVLAAASVGAQAEASTEAQSSAASEGSFLLTIPLSGPLKELSHYVTEGAQLALKTYGGGLNLEITDEFGQVRDELDPDKMLMVIGYFTESRFAADAPRYLYLRKPVLLPFLTTAEAAGRGPGTFFRLMPSPAEQGRFLAEELLKQRRRPRRLVVVESSGPAQRELAESFIQTLRQPPDPPEAKGSKGQRPQKLKALDAKTELLRLNLAEVMDPNSVEALAKGAPDLILVALTLDEALTWGPQLAGSDWAKAPVWGGAALAFRSLGAAWADLGLNLRLLSPVANLASPSTQSQKDFIRSYIDRYQRYPSWLSALSFDTLSLAIKAASAGSQTGAILDFLNTGEHHGLGRYKIAGDRLELPMALMPITENTLGFLP